MSLLMVIISAVMVLMSVAFITLYERHLLSISQNRLGPNKVLFMGVAQPIYDGIKLLMKQELKMFNFTLYLLGPAIAFIIMFFEWTTLPLSNDNLSFKHSILFFLCCIGLMVYTTLLSGVASGSKYSFIGGIRAVCQTVSYEVAIVLIILIVIVHFQSYVFLSDLSVLWFTVLPMWLVCFISETNRAPFDFSEGESELVSGFNTEYSSVSFVLLFLSEYGSIILLSYLTSSIWFDSSQTMSIFIFSLIIVIRSSFPRFRYDFLMKLLWFVLLPVTIFTLGFSLLF